MTRRRRRGAACTFGGEGTAAMLGVEIGKQTPAVAPWVPAAGGLVPENISLESKSWPRICIFLSGSRGLKEVGNDLE